MNSRVRDLTIAGVWFLLDQGTKLWAQTLEAPVQVIPRLLRFDLAHNTGAMFSLFHNWPDPWRQILLTGLPLIAIPAILVLLWRAPAQEKLARLGLALILGGALGNLLDRVRLGHVIDFIAAYAGWTAPDGWLVSTFGTNQFPTFNIADTGLCVGAGLLLLEVLVTRKKGS